MTIYKHEDCRDDDRDCRDNDRLHGKEPIRKEHDKRPDVIISCGNASGLTLPTFGGLGVQINGGGYVGYPPSLTVGTVSVDASKFDCARTKIDFSTIINYKATIPISLGGGLGFSIRLTFQLSKVCDKGHKIPLDNWVYEKSILLGSSGSVCLAEEAGFGGGFLGGGLALNFDFKEDFGFTWCECEECPDCCKYILEVVDVQTFNVENLSLTSSHINAVASECSC
jgi:hypothetical protein